MNDMIVRYGGGIVLNWIEIYKRKFEISVNGVFPK